MAGTSAGAMVVNKAIQVGANVVLSNALYMGQSIVTGSPITAEGFLTATAGGVISGLTYNFSLPRSIAISAGVEVAGYPNEIVDIVRILFGRKPRPAY